MKSILRGSPRQATKLAPFQLALLLFTVSVPLAAAEPAAPNGRILFLGDSITYSGQYVEYFETALRLLPDHRPFELINLGLPSETVSGLTEPGHAGGAFPRPDLHERLSRALHQIKPDVVFACYGMNDGIYYPFSEERFDKFQSGVRWLHEQVTRTGARLIWLTPPTFDPLPLQGKTLPAGLTEYRRPYEGYNQVLDRYSAWLLTQRTNGWEVIDLHGPMNRFLTKQRQHDPGFRFAGDGVHPNDAGHWLMARQLLGHFEATRKFAAMENPQEMLAGSPNGAAVFKLVQQRQRLLKDAWLTAVGHRRPGMNRGLPLPEAQERADDLEARIHDLTSALPAPEIQRDEQGNVTLTCIAAHLTVRYTLDGSEPQRDAGAYLAPIPFPYQGTVKARAFTPDDKANGPVASVDFSSITTRGVAPVRPPSVMLPMTQNRDWRNYDWPARHAAVCALVRERQPALVFIGDSITHFFGGEPRARIVNGGEVWQKFYAPRNTVNLGFGWDRTENVLWRLRHGELDHATPKVAVVLIGTNNLDVNTPEEIVEGIRALCNELHRCLPQTKILLLGILPRSPHPDAHRAKLADVNTGIAKLEGHANVTYLDIGQQFVNPDGSIPAELMADYLHPTARGYAVLAKAIEPMLVKLLGE